MAREEKFAGIMIFTLKMGDFDAKGGTFPLLRYLRYFITSHIS